VQAGELDTALELYAPDAVVHTPAGATSGRGHLRSQLEESGLVGAGALPDVRGEDGAVVATWPGAGHDGGDVVVRARIAHGLIAEQWVEPVPPAAAGEIGATGEEGTPIEVSVHGDVRADAVDYARGRVRAVMEHVGEPVRFAGLKLTVSADPARVRPALAQATLDVDGDIVRAHVAGHELREAADLLQRRLSDKVEHRASRRRALRRRGERSEAGEWRHGDASADRPLHFDRPPDQRQLVRHKMFALEELTPDEAAFDMEQLDYDFHLFRDLASGEDAVLERLPDRTWRLTRLHAAGVEPGPTAIELTVVDHAAPGSSVDEAIARLEAGGEPFVFFSDVASGRGSVVYRRYDGHYGLVSAA
jgi:hypothetical protein